MRKIMVVDDEFLVRVGFKSLLDWEANGYTIVCDASDGGEALNKIEQFQPDIILTDLKMDGMDGFELIKQCRQKYPYIRFVVLSSYNDFENVKRAMKLGADDYIFKLTANPEELLKILDEVSQKLTEENEKQHDDMERFVKNNVFMLKRNFMRDAVKGSILNAKEYMEDFSELLRLKVSFEKPYVIFYISIDDYENAERENDEESILKYSMENMIQEIIDKVFTADIFNYEKGDMILIIQAEDDSYKFCEKLSELYDTLLLYTKRYLGVTISAYVSQAYTGLVTLKEAVGHIRRRLCRRLPSEYGRLNFYMNHVRDEIAYIETYVRQNLSKDLTVASVAGVVNMSESYFSHLFKKETGLSFTNYVNQVRIEQAKELLKESRLKINEIALAVGLENSNYFSTLFKKLTGVAPNQYREDEQNKEL